MHSMADVYKALMALSVEVANGRPLQVMNSPFTPPKEGTWFRVHIMPGETEVFTLGSQGLDKVEGILQIDIMTPLASGHGTPLSEYATMYSKARQWHGPVMVHSCSYASGFESGGWYVTPVTFRWRAVTQHS